MMSNFEEIAKFVEVNPQYQIFRHFNTVRLETIYQLQHRLSVLVKKIEKNDIQDDTLEELSSTLQSYDVHLVAQATINNLPTPRKLLARDFTMFFASGLPDLGSDLGVDGINKFNFDTLVVLTPTEDTWVSSFADKYGGKYFESKSWLKERVYLHINLCFILLCSIMTLSNGVELGKLAKVFGMWLLFVITLLLFSKPVPKRLCKGDIPVSETDEIYVPFQ